MMMFLLHSLQNILEAIVYVMLAIVLVAYTQWSIIFILQNSGWLVTLLGKFHWPKIKITYEDTV